MVRAGEFRPGTILWFVIKGNDSNFKLCRDDETAKLGSWFLNGNLFYTSDLGTDETVAFPSTIGSVTADSQSNTYAYGIDFIGRVDNNAYVADFKDLAYGDAPDDFGCYMAGGQSSIEWVPPGYLRAWNSGSLGYVASQVPEYRHLYSQDNEVIARIKITYDQASLALKSAAQYSLGESGYHVLIDYTNQKYQLFWWSNSATQIGSDVSATIALDTWYWCRFRLYHTDLQFRMWSGDFSSEPGTWDFDENSSNVDWGGYPGIATYSTSTDYLVDYLSVGAWNEPAPEPFLGTVTTVAASNVAATTARLNANLTSMGGESTVKAWFEWGVSGSGFTQTTTVQELTATGTFYADISSLTDGVTYQFKVVIDRVENSNKVYGDTFVFCNGGDYSIPVPILNGDAEDGINDWVVVTGTLNTRSSNPVDHTTGTGNYFYGDACAIVDAYQEIDLSTIVQGDLIDDAGLELVVTYWQSSYDDYDEGQVKVRMDNASHTQIATGENTLLASTKQIWTERTVTVDIPANTRYIDIVIYGERQSGTALDAYFDDFSAVIQPRSGAGPGGYRPAVIIVC